MELYPQYLIKKQLKHIQVTVAEGIMPTEE